MAGNDTNGGVPRRRRISKRRTETLLRLYRELEHEWRGALSDVRTTREGTGGDDETESIAQMLTARMDQIVDHRYEVEEALERIDAGTYGICDECGTRIPAARLEANPAAVRCTACQRSAELAGRL